VWWRCGHGQWETLTEALANPKDYDAYAARDQARRAERDTVLKQQWGASGGGWAVEPPAPAPVLPVLVLCKGCGRPVTSPPGEQPADAAAREVRLLVPGDVVSPYRYSTNHQIVIDADTSLVVVVGRPLAGNRNDCKAWEESGAKAAVGRTTTIADGGYPGTGLVIPHRRQRGQTELSGWKEEHNKSHKQVRARVELGTRVPSTMSTASLANRLRGWRASIGARWSMIRSAADFDTPNSGASCRIVRFVPQYAATSRARSSSGRLHGRPLRTSSAP
jgi:hypothetical protein